MSKPARYNARHDFETEQAARPRIDDGQFPNVCDACEKTGRLFWCNECCGFYHDECFEGHGCIGYYDSRGHWVRE